MTSPYDADWAWNQAAHCYELDGQLEEAGRCYANARQFRQAARVFRAAGNVRATAAMESRAERYTVAAWIYVHELGDVDAARTSLQADPLSLTPTAGTELLLGRRLVEVRCDLAAGAPAETALPVLADLQNYLATEQPPIRALHVEDWGIAIAEAANRFDQVALTFAAALRGGDPAAGERWRRWAQDRYGQRIVIPQATPAATREAA
ncbi:hypothetical protein ACQPZX_48790 [Actinoplanes sp. CA-142083]|uniref:hypothetical protein n=1 Tax=Actinoplanes sp. CA-142083 TaxID=3239903 RepID=UPI003D93044A